MKLNKKLALWIGITAVSLAVALALSALMGPEVVIGVAVILIFIDLWLSG